MHIFYAVDGSVLIYSGMFDQLTAESHGILNLAEAIASEQTDKT